MRRPAGLGLLLRILLLLVILVVSHGCTSAAVRLDRRAASDGLALLVLPGDGFGLRGYAQNLPPRSSGAAERLHVYLEGDGRPWVDGGTRVARDPHGERNLAFELMRLDPAPSLYLKRPCYQDLPATGRSPARDGGVGTPGTPAAPPCHPLLWTHQRYSETVLDALEAGLRSFLDRHPARELHFVGYSGGGVLAMLLAPRFEESRRVVTIAANLDVGAWTRLHGYTPLVGSLDPSTAAPLPEHVAQLHLVGELDANVPPDLVRSAVARQPGAALRIVDGFDHTCCWRQIWPEVLGEWATAEWASGD